MYTSRVFVPVLGKPDMVPEAGNFTFISSPSGVNMNYHTIHIPANDTGLHMIIRPASPDDVYYVYLKYGDFPNETYFDWKGEASKKNCCIIFIFTYINMMSLIL